jgi:hypothetical protein
MSIINSNRQKEIKMKNKLFDDFVQKQFDGYKPEVGEHIWENIAQKKDRKKPLVFWFSNAAKIAAIAVVMLSCIGIGYYFRHNSNKGTKEFSLNKEKNVLPITNDATQNDIKTLEKETVTTATTKQVQSNGKSESDETTLNNENEETIISSTTSKQVQPKNKTFSTLINRNNIVSKNSTINKNNNTSSVILESNNENKTASIGRKNKYVNEKTSIHIYKGEEIINKTLIANVETLDIVNENNKFIPKIYLKKLPTIAFVPCPEAEENAAGNKKYFELYSGPDYIFKTYSDTGDAYIAQRKASTGIHYAFSAGLRYTRVFGSGISIRTGINYSQINERFIAFNGFVLEHVVQVNSIGDTIANYTAASVQYKKSTNVYRTIDIPIQAGFEFGNGRLHTNISAGALVNILSKQTGNAVEPNGNVIDLSSSKTSSQYQYKSNVGISFLGSVSVYYKVNEKLHLMAEPYIRYSFAPMTKAEITFKQKFHTAGLRFGLRWDL